VLAADAGSAPWRALLTADRDLTLDGLELRRGSGGAAGRLVCVEGADLRAVGCLLAAPEGVAVVHRHGGELSLRDCHVEAGGVAVSVEVGERPACAVALERTEIDVHRIDGVGVSVWAREARRPTAVGLSLQGGAVAAGRAVALAAAPGEVRVTAEGVAFTARDGVLSCAGRADWRPATRWQGRGNRYRVGGWLRVDGAAAPVRGLDGWRAFWGDAEAGSVEEAAP
jgi:hypothetical protein